MKRLIILLLLSFSLFSCAGMTEYRFAKKWTKTDTALEMTYIGLTLIDWGQTRCIVKENYEETNIILGKHPSMEKVDTLIPLGIAAHAVLAGALPPKYRRYWQVFWIGVEGSAVLHNYNIGLRIVL